jgi:ATP-dependent protease HslVU (ClpYQ) peptidase subunit
MTVIATDGYTMAGDSIVTSSDGTLYSKTLKKVYRIGKEIVGLAGNTSQCAQYLDYLKHGGEKPELENFMALHLRRSGVFLVDDKTLNKLKVKVPYAIGSGGEIALGAMLEGASPEKACRQAIKRNVRCGGSVIVEAL